MKKINIKTKKLFGFLLLFKLLIIVLSINAYAFEDLEEINEIRKRVRNNLFQQLDLTPKQNRQIKNQHKEFDLNVKERISELIKHKKKFMEELKKKDADPDKIELAADEIKRLGEELFDLKIESVLSLKKTLTPKQFEQLLELRKKAKKFGSGLRELFKRRMQGVLDN